jgi:hypothetical protein
MGYQNLGPQKKKYRRLANKGRRGCRGRLRQGGFSIVRRFSPYDLGDE